MTSGLSKLLRKSTMKKKVNFGKSEKKRPNFGGSEVIIEADEDED